MHRPPGFLFFVALFSASGLAHADQIITFSFTATLATPIANQTSVTGQFSLDQTIGEVSDFSFFTPIGLIAPTNYGEVAGDAVSPNGLLVDLSFFENTAVPSGYLDLVFPGELRSFSGGPLYTGPIFSYPFGPYRYADLNCQAVSAACSPVGFSYFTSGSATPILVAAPEPTPLAFFSCALASCWGWHLKRSCGQKR